MLKSILRLFVKSRPFVPPTKKQLDYAWLCGVNVTNSMDREAVSNAIDAAFAADPKLKFKINARRKRKQKIVNAKLDVMSAADKRTMIKWENAADEQEHFLVVYQSGNDKIVDILECENARVDTDTNAIVVNFLAPRIEDVVVGWDGKKKIRERELCWDQPLKIPTGMIVESRKVQIYEDQVKKYQSTIARKLKALSN